MPFVLLSKILNVFAWDEFVKLLVSIFNRNGSIAHIFWVQLYSEEERVVHKSLAHQELSILFNRFLQVVDTCMVKLKHSANSLLKSDFFALTQVFVFKCLLLVILSSLLENRKHFSIDDRSLKIIAFVHCLSLEI